MLRLRLCLALLVMAILALICPVRVSRDLFDGLAKYYRGAGNG